MAVFNSSRLTIEIAICDVSVNGKRPYWQFIRAGCRCIEYDPHENAAAFSGYTSWGGGRVKGRVTPEVIGRSGQRAAIVNETHRSHQMLTFDWRPRSPSDEAGSRATPGGVLRAAQPRDSVCLPPLTFSSAASVAVLRRRSRYRPGALLFFDASCKM